MPTLHRLATLRDDVIYFIALYQSWIYRVDHRRVNEFGQGGGDSDPGEGEDVGGYAVVEEKETEGGAVAVKVEEKKVGAGAASGAERESKGATKRR